MKKFTRKIEDFVCENCGTIVKGNGYTNHCPNCLFSKHVDINPGDRMSTCSGLMKPIDVLQKDGEFVILHKCEKCGFERKNKVVDNDNREALINITKHKVL